MNKNIVRQIVNILALVLTLAVNGLANALPLNGQTTAEISDRFKVYFVPAGYVFAIWGLIYVGLILFAVYQALPAQRDNPRLSRLGYLFPLSCLANAIWLFMWHFELFVLSVVVMVLLLASLIAMYLRLGIGRAAVSAGERWLVQVPFSVYLGWVAVATIANVTSTLDYLQWGRWGISAELWAVIMLVVGTLVTAAMLLNRKDIAYALVAIWAFVGIAVKQAGAPMVATTAWVTAALLALLIVVSRFLRLSRFDTIPAR